MVGGDDVPDGYMLFYRRVVPIGYVEKRAKEEMEGFDELPADVREAINVVPLSPAEARVIVARHGDAAAEVIMTKYYDRLVRGKR